MPYIHTQVSKSLTDEVRDALTKDLGEAVQALGKSEDWLMLRFEDNCSMAFRGRRGGDVCFVGISVYGTPGEKQTAAMTERVTACIAERTGISPENIYIRYLSTDTWGWRGSNF